MPTHETLIGLFTDIADAIRIQTGEIDPIVADEFPSKILNIQAGGVRPSGTIGLTANGTYDVTNYAAAVVTMPIYNGEVE